MSEFLFMNKDEVVFSFMVNHSQIGINYELTSSINGKLPLGFVDLGKWLDKRYVLNYRQDIDLLFKSIGIDSIEDKIAVTHCIALTDTYWVKRIDDNIAWKSISPYRNTLNKVIAEYAFCGEINGKNITSSPDFSTDGNYPKCWVKNGSGIFMYKAGSSGAMNAGYEPYSEVFAYQLGKYLGFDSLAYSLAHYKTREVSICKCMCSEEIGLCNVIDAFGFKQINYGELLQYTNNNLSSEDYNKLIDMLLLDILLCNVDRHYGNIGVLVNNQTQEVIGYSKIYDNNQSCIPYYVVGDNLQEYVDNLTAKDGQSFTELYKCIRSSYARSKLQEARNFRFKQLNNKRADSRTDVLNEMLQYQISKCLGN